MRNPRITHGLTRKGAKHPLYNTWADLRSRCSKPSDPAFKNYGARGITVDARWQDFAVFVSDMGNRPPGKSLERVDNNGPYSKENCRWATRTEQANNRRSNVFIEYKGQSKTIADWSRETGIGLHALWERIQRFKWPLERAMTEPMRKW